MKLFHSNYSGVDVGVGGKQYRVERIAGGGAYVNVPDGHGHLLFEHGFSKVDAIDLDAVARDAMRTKAVDDAAKKGSTRAKAPEGHE